MYHIAIFGGTFDPIHNGHLQTSLTIQNHFNFNSFIILPCKMPLIKPAATASKEQRIKMIELAIHSHPGFRLDLREINRDTPSYMVDTLTTFREEYPEASITLVMGYDAFVSLPQWYQWENLISLANIMVINRNEFVHQPLPKVLHEVLERHQAQEKEELLNRKAGVILFFDAGNYPISSSTVREAIKKHEPRASTKLPKEVWHYIKDEGLYQ